MSEQFVISDTHFTTLGHAQYINVCVEHTEYKPLSLDELKELL